MRLGLYALRINTAVSYTHLDVSKRQAFGTVVRPNAKDPSANYDLDFICQVSGSRADYAPSELRQKIEDAFTSSAIYGGKLKVCKDCFTVEYADINGVGFTIDIVPAADETSENKKRLAKKKLGT